MNISKEIWIVVFGSILIYLLWGVAIEYSITTGYYVYDIFAVMTMTPILIFIYIYIVYRLFEEIKNLGCDNNAR